MTYGQVFVASTLLYCSCSWFWLLNTEYTPNHLVSEGKPFAEHTSFLFYHLYVVYRFGNGAMVGRFHAVTFFFAISTQFLMSFLRLTVQWLPYYIVPIQFCTFTSICCSTVLFGNFMGVIRLPVSEWVSEWTNENGGENISVFIKLAN